MDVAIAIHATARVTTTTTSNPVTSAVIEYEPQSLGMAITDHSAWDTAVIGTKVQADIEEGGNSIAAVIKGNTKIYDGLPIEPESFAVSGSKGANASLFEVTYEAVEPGNYADYTSRTINGADYRDTGAVNATRYHATVKLTQKAIDAGWVLDTMYFGGRWRNTRNGLKLVFKKYCKGFGIITRPPLGLRAKAQPNCRQHSPR